jgi:hypothetical protein
MWRVGRATFRVIFVSSHDARKIEARLSPISRKKDTVEEQHTTHASVLLSGADYLDSIVTDMEKEAETMQAKAHLTHIPQVRQGYERFAEVLRHCAQTLRDKSHELRKA